MIGNALEELFERGADGWSTSMEILVKVLYFVQIKDAQQSSWYSVNPAARYALEPQTMKNAIDSL